MKVVAFLPVKGNSERIENKNCKLLDGKPLFLHTLEKLASCDFIDEVYLDSEADEILQMAPYLDYLPLKRDAQLANNKTDGHALFYNQVRQVEADIYIQILCTSPFIKPETLKKAIEILKESDEYDSVLLVKKDKQYLWKDGQPLYNPDKIPNSVDLEDTIIETMGLYVVKADVAKETRKRVGRKPFLLEAEPIEAVDVNFPLDFELADFIAAGRREKERAFLRNLKPRLSSAMLSDILDNIGFNNQVIKSLNPNREGAKFFGRAKTLRLRALKDGEGYEGIYEALKTYNYIIPDDIIVVENELKEFAYFGELNANLAIRAGAKGAIVDSMTRDSSQVAELGFPVFARGNTCQDVKRRATVDHMNQAVEIDGVKVAPGDLVFADSDGVIVIPRRQIDTVLEEAGKVVSMERSILAEISQGRSVEDIYQSFGGF